MDIKRKNFDDNSKRIDNDTKLLVVNELMYIYLDYLPKIFVKSYLLELFSVLIRKPNYDNWKNVFNELES